ncbi:MAG: hypothetical protein IH621_17615 [Krumholzibacteria bacterium]|nr:hypothetical protein [Candidatus Krumholzibacteria bacterium]
MKREHDDHGHGGSGEGRSADDMLDRLLRDSAYEGRPRDEFKRGLHRELAHNFQIHRRQNVRTAVVAAAAVVVAFAAFQFTDVGSDNFALVDTGGVVDRGVKVYEPTFRGGRVGGGELVGDSVVSLDREFLERIEEATAAGEGTLVGVNGWTVAGSTMLIAEIRVVVDGEPVITSHELQKMDSAAAPAMIRFIKTAREDFMVAVEQGLVPVSGTEFMTVLGRRVLVTRYTREVEGIGLVTHWRGAPLDGS